jgi:hypothetical protein
MDIVYIGMYYMFLHIVSIVIFVEPLQSDFVYLLYFYYTGQYLHIRTTKICCLFNALMLRNIRNARSVVPVVRLAWLRRLYSRQLEQAMLTEWESIVQWRPKAAASHTLPVRGAWARARPGPELVRTKGARSPEAKPPCGSFPQVQGLLWLLRSKTY